jgi:23S rRNA (cytosine1962-C5)-methyltransferase
MKTVHLKSASYDAFIYARMIARIEGEVEDGDLVQVIDKHGKFFGWGFYNSRSQIGLRMFSHQHAMPDDKAIAGRIRQAVALRREVLQLDSVADAYRLVHAEGDGLSGLVADRFGEYVVIELFSLAMFQRLDLIQDAIVDAGVRVKNFVMRADKEIADQEGFRMSELSGNKPHQTTIREHGVQFHVELSRGHKTGFFCDQRDNRLEISRLTAGKKMLDLCCYSGGFSCYAAKLGQAAEVTAVDLDETVLQVARRNAELNQVKITFHHADAFPFLRDAGREGKRWDVVVVDPSKFVYRTNQMEEGLLKYSDLNRLAMQVVAPGGLLLTCSCSGLVDQPTFLDILARAARAAGRELQIFRVSGAGCDHPVMADALKAFYLKAVWARVV